MFAKMNNIFQQHMYPKIPTINKRFHDININNFDVLKQLLEQQMEVSIEQMMNDLNQHLYSLL